MRRVDLERTRLAITFAFASTVSGGLFAEALEGATFAPSRWDPAAFANDLFVRDFARLCFRARLASTGEPLLVEAHLFQLLTRPPADPAIASHRRAILAELVSKHDLRSALERLYLSLCHLRGRLEGAAGIGKWDRNRRQLDILALVRQIVDAMATDFGPSQTGLARLAAVGRRVQAEEPYRSLCDLLRYDERLATLDLRIGVGADGRIRAFDVASVREDQENPFVSPPWRRWLAKLELFARGYRFGDGEVMARLIDAVFDGLRDEIVGFVQLLGDVEFYLGALGFHDGARAAGLSVCLPELSLPGEPREIHGLFNPLLVAHGVRAVPCDLKIDRHDATVLITGPNSGGKTRLLQSLGLTQLLAQVGAFVPARSARISPASALVVSLIEEAKADQAEGRLGTELLRIRALFERLPPGSMVLLDELCSGTNPSEGEEIFELVVTMLARLSPQAFITTHFLAFASRLEREKKIAALRFLQVDLGEDHRPTYQFATGVARTSLAAHAAARLGVTGEQLLALVERNLAGHAPTPPHRKW